MFNMLIDTDPQQQEDGFGRECCGPVIFTLMLSGGIL